MDKNKITQSFKQAKDLVGDVEEQYNAAAFQVVFQRLLDGGQPESTESVEVKRATLPTTINEFLASRGVKAHIERVLAIAYFYQNTKKEPVTREDIERAYKDSRQQRPRNVADIIATLTRKGWFVDSSEKKDKRKAWHITPTGERYVEEQLSGKL